jgi:hypothetical protein
MAISWYCSSLRHWQDKVTYVSNDTQKNCPCSLPTASGCCIIIRDNRSADCSGPSRRFSPGTECSVAGCRLTIHAAWRLSKSKPYRYALNVHYILLVFTSHNSTYLPWSTPRTHIGALHHLKFDPFTGGELSSTNLIASLLTQTGILIETDRPTDQLGVISQLELVSCGVAMATVYRFPELVSSCNGCFHSRFHCMLLMGAFSTLWSCCAVHLGPGHSWRWSPITKIPVSRKYLYTQWL